MAVAKNHFITLEDSDKLIEKRVKLWDDFDNAVQLVSELNVFSDKFNDPGVEELTSPLTKSGAPPEEVIAAIEKINQEQKNIQVANSKIQSLQDDIKKVESNSYIIVAVSIVAAIIIIGIIIILVNK